MLFPIAGVVASAISLAWGWGFTVDDALISTRVANHLSAGLGYRFNPDGPVTDCVTPLGWAQLLAPLSSAGPWQGLMAARMLGAMCHLLSGALLAWALRRSGVGYWLASATLAVLALSLPWGAWGSAGMETPLVALLATLCLLDWRSPDDSPDVEPKLSHFRWTAVGSALACALRPELAPWALVLAALLPARGPKLRLVRCATVACGPLAVALIRAAVFGSPAPLAVLAKPSDLDHGFQYASAAMLWLGIPCLFVSWRSYARLPPRSIAHGIALLAHVGSIVVAGGDWMALFRLFVPLLPLGLAVSSQLLSIDPPKLRWAKLSVAAALCLGLAFSVGPKARRVVDARQHLIHHAAPLLVDSRTVASLDVGWVGTVGPFEVVDLAGVTDRLIALLPGGHTSKRLPDDLLRRRNVDTLVVLLAPGAGLEQAPDGDWRRLPFARTVESRLAQLNGASEFVVVGQLPLLGADQHYLVLRRLTERVALALDQQCTRLTPFTRLVPLGCPSVFSWRR